MRFPLCMNFTIPRDADGAGSGIGGVGGGPADNGAVGGGSNDGGGSDTPPQTGS
jgi:hypothetical protein